MPIDHVATADFCPSPDCDAGLTPRAAAELARVEADPEILETFADLDDIAAVIAATRRASGARWHESMFRSRWPLEAMPGYVAAGADLVCLSAKYFGGPNAGGFMVGTRAMIDAVTANTFTRCRSPPTCTPTG